MIRQLLDQLILAVIQPFEIRVTDLQVLEAEFVDLLDAEGKEFHFTVAKQLLRVAFKLN